MDTAVKITDIKKGARVELRNGWFATVMDNCVKQHTRVCNVEGFVTEMGSVYSTDIVRVLTDSGNWAKVEHTDGQRKRAAQRKVYGF